MFSSQGDCATRNTFTDKTENHLSQIERYETLWQCDNRTRVSIQMKVSCLHVCRMPLYIVFSVLILDMLRDSLQRRKQYLVVFSIRRLMREWRQLLVSSNFKIKGFEISEEQRNFQRDILTLTLELKFYVPVIPFLWVVLIPEWTLI